MNLSELLHWGPIGFGVPGKNQWPLYVLSKLALVLAPAYAVWAYRRGLIPLWQKLWPSQGWRKSQVVGEKLLAHAAFYVGMGLPIIGLESLFDLPRVLGFTVANYFFHEVTPLLIKENWLKRLFPEWIPTLGVNLLMGEELLEISAYIGSGGRLKVIESPYSESKDFIRSIVTEERAGEHHVIIEFKSMYVPDNVRPIIRFRAPSNLRRLSRAQVAKMIRVDLGELEPFAMPVYVNDYGQKSILWRNQYWTKFFNEMGGRSYVTYSFAVLRKAVIVLIGTPIAFATGNLFVHLSQGGVWNWDVYLLFSYGIIFAFTLGGMYGASICSTLVELATWLYYRKLKQLKISAEPSPGRAIRTKSRFRSLKWGPDKFGVFLEQRSFVYRSFRFLVGGIVAGGLGAWFVTMKVGGVWQDKLAAFQEQHFLEANLSSARQGRSITSEVPDFYFPTLEKSDFDNRLFEETDKKGSGR